MTSGGGGGDWNRAQRRGGTHVAGCDQGDSTGTEGWKEGRMAWWVGGGLL